MFVYRTPLRALWEMVALLVLLLWRSSGATEALYPLPPSYAGGPVVRNVLPAIVPIRPSPLRGTPLDATRGDDVYVQDGSETALAINPADGTNLVAGYNERHAPDPPLSTSTDGDVSWSVRSFPVGDGSFTAPPFDPWVVAGNTPGEFFASAIRRDAGGSGTTRTVVAHSTDSGASFTRIFEADPQFYQRRAMMDVDRTAARGGGSGTTYDGTIYVAYDLYDPGTDLTSGPYAGSFLDAVSPQGELLRHVMISGPPGTGPTPFIGAELQPVAGVTDGSVYLQGAATRREPGATAVARFHELTKGGAGPNLLSKSMLLWDAAGQQLGTSDLFGVNGHAIDMHGYLGIDRSGGPRHGWLFFLSNRNPNPNDQTRDQGDIWLSISRDGALTWVEAPLPTAAGKTQYFPMLDVDEQGWLHVGYYQNEGGATDGGVLNASTANVYYMLSIDGGSSWSPPVRVNGAATSLNLQDPPPDLSGVNYYLYGIYQQLRATGAGADTRVYVLWSQYDQDREAQTAGTGARVYCTKLAVSPPMTTMTAPFPTTTTTLPAAPSTPDCGVPAPTFTSLDCRFDGLIARLETEPDLGTLRGPLLRGASAASSLVRGAQAVVEQSRRRAKAKLKTAIGDVSHVLGRLRARHARQALPLDARQSLIDAFQPLLGDLQTLHRMLRRPAAG